MYLSFFPFCRWRDRGPEQLCHLLICHLPRLLFFPFSHIIAVFKPQQQEGLFCFVGMSVLRGIIPEIVWGWAFFLKNFWKITEFHSVICFGACFVFLSFIVQEVSVRQRSIQMNWPTSAMLTLLLASFKGKPALCHLDVITTALVSIKLYRVN